VVLCPSTSDIDRDVFIGGRALLRGRSRCPLLNGWGFFLLPPEPQAPFPGHPLIIAEVLHVLERECCIGVAIALEDDLGVEEGPVVEIYIGERAVVFVDLVLVVFKTNLLPLDQALRKFVGLLAKNLDRLPGILGFRSVDTDKPDGFVSIKDNCVPINDASASSPGLADGEQTYCQKET